MAAAPGTAGVATSVDLKTAPGIEKISVFSVFSFLLNPLMAITVGAFRRNARLQLDSYLTGVSARRPYNLRIGPGLIFCVRVEVLFAAAEGLWLSNLCPVRKENHIDDNRRARQTGLLASLSVVGYT